jgi:uncharacterized protein YndB with AHSA1/START domain
MASFSTAVEIAAPPERVWAVMTDVERWPEWTASTTSVVRNDAGPLRVGSRTRIHQPKLRAADWEVTAVEPGKSFTWVTRSPGVSVTGYHAVEAAARGSRALVSIQFAGLLGPLIGWIMRGLNRRYLEMEAAGLKRRSEGSP